MSGGARHRGPACLHPPTNPAVFLWGGAPVSGLPHHGMIPPPHLGLARAHRHPRSCGGGGVLAWRSSSGRVSPPPPPARASSGGGGVCLAFFFFRRAACMNSAHGMYDGGAGGREGGGKRQVTPRPLSTDGWRWLTAPRSSPPVRARQQERLPILYFFFFDCVPTYTPLPVGGCVCVSVPGGSTVDVGVPWFVPATSTCAPSPPSPPPPGGHRCPPTSRPARGPEAGRGR